MLLASLAARGTYREKKKKGKEEEEEEEEGEEGHNVTGVMRGREMPKKGREGG